MADVPTQLSAALADRYRLERELGQGGMATVYLAQDLKHDRRVAIKVLRPELAAVIGAERFLSEIKTTANLQHPHILPLHDSGAVGPFLFYVMPFVEGESLRDRLSREKQLPIADAIRIASEAASALDYAHRHGVIHRDIKPENLLLHDGSALVADFGIALAVSSAGGTRMTETGMSLGTPHYMSPEQAMGEREITARSDIYALGAMLYEMLLGEPPFTGPTAQSIFAKVMTEKPAPLSLRRDTVPAGVEDAVLIALSKLPADRFGTAAEFAAALTATGTARTRAIPAAPAAPRLVNRSLSAVALLATIAAAFFAFQVYHAVPQPVTRLEMQLPAMRAGQLQYRGNSFALAPDGSRIAYVGAGPAGSTRLWIRARGDGVARPLEGTEGADAPFFSPDGRWLGFVANGKLFKVAVDGGAPVALADSVPGTLPAGLWGPDQQIIYVGSGYSLRRIRASGGRSELIEPPPPQRANVFPAALPRSDAVLVTECSNNCAAMTLVALNLETHHRDTLLASTARAWYLPTGDLVAVRQDGSVVGVRFDAKRLRVEGTPVPLLTGIHLELGVVPELSIAGDGTLAYLPSDSAGGDITVVRVDRQGNATVLDPSWRTSFSSLALSPDGRRLAVSIGSSTAGRSDLWVKQLDRGPLTRLSFAGSLNYRAAWLPDGRSLGFTSDRDSGFSRLYTMRADGSGEAVRMFPGDTTQVDESQWSRDGQWLVYRTGTSDGARDIYARQTRGDTTRVTVSATRYDEYMSALSPDGRWVAYVSVESGREEVYVRPFPQTERARWQVSTAGGAQPMWSHSGRELFYVSAADTMVAVDVPARPEFQTGDRRALFSVNQFVLLPFHRAIDIEPDDRAFIMMQRLRTPGIESRDLRVVLNWFEEVRAKLRAAGK
jgi:serine/threonine-protein kinase